MDIVTRASVQQGMMRFPAQRGTMSFSLYFVGALIVIGGVAWGMIKAGLPTVWVIIAAVIMLGVGILSGVSHTRSRDLPKDPS